VDHQWKENEFARHPLAFAARELALFGKPQRAMPVRAELSRNGTSPAKRA
jgi:hypothetical protein